MSRRKKFRALAPQKKQSPYPSTAAVYDESHHAQIESSSTASFSMVPYDESLLERSRDQWQSGDWPSLTKLNRETLQQHPDRAKLALLAAAGHLELDNPQSGEQFVRLAQDWGCSKKLISQILVSSVYHRLGRAALNLGQIQRALDHFKTAIAMTNQRVDGAIWGEAIALRENLRLGRQPQGVFFLEGLAPSIGEDAPPESPDVGITSYAQNFEDVMLWRALGRVKSGIYVDVGAQDPIVDSVSKAFYERGWRGVHVEPISAYAEALRHDRPDERVIEAVLAAESGTQIFFMIPQTGLSTGSRVFAERHMQRGFEVQELTVRTSTLSAVFDEVGKLEIQWLKIDVEGMEEVVLSGWGCHTARPWVVIVEATEPNSQVPTHHKWEQQLQIRGYIFAYFDGLNRFYIHSTHGELMHFFKTPPNVFDSYKINGM